MMGSFLTRPLIMALGYAYPAYECYKTVEKNKPEIEQLRFWCQYWIFVAALTIFERVGESFISWLPMYNEAKLAFFIYLWCPGTRGTTYVYESFLRPYVARHEREIDESLVEVRVRVGEMVVMFCQKAAGYGQTRIFEILQYVAAQSDACRPTPVQRQPDHLPTAAMAQPAPPPFSTQQSQRSNLPPELPKVAVAPISALLSPGAADPAGGASGSQADVGKSSSAGEEVNPPEETVMGETVGVNGGRLRARPRAGGAAGR